MYICVSSTEMFESDYSLESKDSYDLTFRNWMEEIYLKIQDFLKEE